MELSDFNFVPVGNGQISLSHRPGRFIPYLREMGCTHVVTLLKNSEHAHKFGHAVKQAGLEWILLPVPNGKYPVGEIHTILLDAMPRLVNLLDEGAWMLSHCSAGIHRTGMVTYALLRWRGFDSHAALDLIAQMRLATYEGVGEKRLRWGDDIVLANTKATDNASINGKSLVNNGGGEPSR